MARRAVNLTAFGEDLDRLLKQAGKFTIREYSDECGVSYKYISQLRTLPNRRPGRLYADLLKPFTRLKIIDLARSQQLSLRHRNRPLSFTECQVLFPDLAEQGLVESIKQAAEIKARQDIQGQIDTIQVIQPTFQLSRPGAPTQLYRRVFVGRETELAQLQSAFDVAMSGQGVMMMVAGEMGIGKTVLCEQLAAHVDSLGGKSLVGHCYSEKSLSLPYLAFAEVLRSHVQTSDISKLREELGTGAPDLARIVPVISEKLEVRPRPRRSPEEERYHLMEAVTHVLGNIAAVQPLLVVLEDLHNADKDTLEMLTYVSRNLASTRLLIVGTYRDVEVDRTHPLSETLAELSRLSAFERILLRGLNADVVKRMFSAITKAEIPVRLAGLIHKHTEGNPLFVQEVIRLLFEEGHISAQGELGQTLKDTTIEIRIPEGLRDVIGRRLSRLSESCNKVLATASVIGRNFRLEVLQRVSDVTDEELFEALAEARKTAVIEEKTGMPGTVDYTFAHTFFRQTLYEEIIAPRRMYLHLQVGQALEEIYSDDLEQHATELAEHFSRSSDPVNMAKAVRYGEIAARQALSVYAYGENIRLLEQALKVQEVLDPEDKEKQCDLLRALSSALTMAGEPRRALDVTIPEAFALAESINDRRRASRACVIAMRAYQGYGGSQSVTTPEFARWIERADRYAEPDTVDRVFADTFLGVKRCIEGHYSEGIRLLRQAIDLARQFPDANIFWPTAVHWPFYAAAPQHAKERLHLMEELAATPRVGVDIATLGTGLFYMGDTFLEFGQRQRTEEVWSELRELAERSSQSYLVMHNMEAGGYLATLDGRLEEAIEMGRSMQGHVEESLGSELWSWLIGNVSFRPHIYTGKYEDALQLGKSTPYLLQAAVTNTLCLAHLGRDDEVVKILAELVMARPHIDSIEDETPAYVDIALLEAAVLVGHRQVAELLIGRFTDTSIHTTGIWYMTCTARHLGAAAALLGRPEEARKYYSDAIDVATNIKFRPELALTRLQLAELLLEHYPDEKSEALEHLDFAINEFREMKMQPSLERALRHKEILGA